MNDQRQIAFRFSTDLVKRIDSYAEKMSGKFVGVHFSRADAARHLIESALAEHADVDDEEVGSEAGQAST